MPSNTVGPPVVESLRKVDAPRAVFVVITDAEGTVRGLVGGLSPLMADLVLATAKTEGQGYVSKVDPDKLVTALGQDCFQVARDFLLNSRTLFYPAFRWDEIDSLERRFPSGLRYWVVISY